MNQMAFTSAMTQMFASSLYIKAGPGTEEYFKEP